MNKRGVGGLHLFPPPLYAHKNATNKERNERKGSKGTVLFFSSFDFVLSFWFQTPLLHTNRPCRQDPPAPSNHPGPADQSAVPRSRFCRISTVYLSKARLSFLLKCLLRSLMEVTSSASKFARRREKFLRAATECHTRVLIKVGSIQQTDRVT